jgi:hypothetical protein
VYTVHADNVVCIEYVYSHRYGNLYDVNYNFSSHQISFFLTQEHLFLPNLILTLTYLTSLLRKYSLQIVAFVVVAGTHYQFLWYLARVFLPGKKELCQLSVLVQPSQYADILTQKVKRIGRRNELKESSALSQRSFLACCICFC